MFKRFLHAGLEMNMCCAPDAATALHAKKKSRPFLNSFWCSNWFSRFLTFLIKHWTQLTWQSLVSTQNFLAGAKLLQTHRVRVSVLHCMHFNLIVWSMSPLQEPAGRQKQKQKCKMLNMRANALFERLTLFALFWEVIIVVKFVEAIARFWIKWMFCALQPQSKRNGIHARKGANSHVHFEPVLFTHWSNTLMKTLSDTWSIFAINQFTLVWCTNDKICLSGNIALPTMEL